MAGKRKKALEPQFIEWEDSQSPQDANWLTQEEINMSPIIIKSVGYPLKETKTSITLAAHYCQHCVHGIMTIPKSAIRKRKVLK